MILNITYQGQSADYDLAIDYHASDADIRRIACEVVRSGSVRGLHVPHLSDTAFDAYVVDRVRSGGGAQRIYLRPKVPFGAGVADGSSHRRLGPGGGGAPCGS